MQLCRFTPQYFVEKRKIHEIGGGLRDFGAPGFLIPLWGRRRRGDEDSSLALLASSFWWWFFFNLSFGEVRKNVCVCVQA